MLLASPRRLAHRGTGWFSCRTWARGVLFVLGLSAANAACNATSSSAPTAGLPSSDAGTVAADVTFDHEGTLAVLPSQSVDLGVSVRGPDGVVQLWLDGDYADASLSEGQVASSGGHARVTLHTPSTTTTFTVVA